MQGRQKLARFNAHEFATLVIDVLTDAKRRQQGNSPDVKGERKCFIVLLLKKQKAMLFIVTLIFCSHFCSQVLYYIIVFYWSNLFV